MNARSGYSVSLNNAGLLPNLDTSARMAAIEINPPGEKSVHNIFERLKN